MVFRPRNPAFVGAASGAIPDQVSGQDSTVNSSTQITVSWNAVTAIPAVTSYTVQRATSSGGSFSDIEESVGNVTSIADASLTAYTNYYYKVKANNAIGSGVYSSETTSQTKGVVPATVTGLSVSVASGSLAVNWSDATGGTPDSGYTYQLERSTSSGSGFSSLESNLTDSDHTDATVSMGTTYYYRVKATNVAGQSASWSSEASGSVPLPSWSSTGSLNRASQGGGCFGSSNTNAVHTGGFDGSSTFQSSNDEIWNNTSWSTITASSSPHSYWNGHGAGASSAAGYVMGGQSSGSGSSQVSGNSYWNNTTWNGKAGCTARSTAMAAGVTSTETALACGNSSNNPSAHTQMYNSSGNSWTTRATANRSVFNTAGGGTASNFVKAGGQYDWDESSSGGHSINVSEVFENSGNTWTTTGTLPFRTRLPSGTGRTGRAVVMVGGTVFGSGSKVNKCYVYTGTSDTAGTWQSGNNSSRSGYGYGMAGGGSAAMGTGGNIGSRTTSCEKYT